MKWLLGLAGLAAVVYVYEKRAGNLAAAATVPVTKKKKISKGGGLVHVVNGKFNPPPNLCGEAMFRPPHIINSIPVGLPGNTVQDPQSIFVMKPPIMSLPPSPAVFDSTVGGVDLFKQIQAQNLVDAVPAIGQQPANTSAWMSMFKSPGVWTWSLISNPAVSYSGDMAARRLS